MAATLKLTSLWSRLCQLNKKGSDIYYTIPSFSKLKVRSTQKDQKINQSRIKMKIKLKYCVSFLVEGRTDHNHVFEAPQKFFGLNIVRQHEPLNRWGFIRIPICIYKVQHKFQVVYLNTSLHVNLEKSLETCYWFHDALWSFWGQWLCEEWQFCGLRIRFYND